MLALADGFDRDLTRNETLTFPPENCGVYEFEGDKMYDIAVDFFTTSQEFYLKVEYSGPDTNEQKEILNSWEASAYPPPPAPSQWAMRTFSSGHTIYAIERLEGLNYAGMLCDIGARCVYARLPGVYSGGNVDM